MLTTLRGLRHLAKRTAGTSLGNNLLSDPSTLAVARKVTELMQSNTQDRQRLNDKLDGHRENVEEKLDSALDRYLSSVEELKTEVKTSFHSLEEKFIESLQALDKNRENEMKALKEEIHSVNKNVMVVAALGSAAWGWVTTAVC